jgi:hypothetical protein
MIYRAPSGFVNLDRLRLRQIAPRRRPCLSTMGLLLRDRFVFVSQGPNSQNLPARSIEGLSCVKAGNRQSHFPLKELLRSIRERVLAIKPGQLFSEGKVGMLHIRLLEGCSEQKSNLHALAARGF